MLKLKKLQILGFKSFCDRTELKFPGDGIAAIVGPNGCGKSNISDAVAWVLGEQSARSLRGLRMEDVIFAGTRDRKPTGMAEVTLHLIDPEVYEGAHTVEPEIEIRDDMPADDWDEAALRRAQSDELDEYTDEMRPGQTEAVEVPPAAAKAKADGATDATVVEMPAAASTPSNLSSSGTPAGEPGADAAAAVAGPQVVLKIRRRKFKTNYRKGEIVVTRRLFRSGESEYQLNGKFCRLRDIQDIFMGTGLGPESYALIEQGRIGQILSSKPTDRRNIVEEAAGITKFKARKRLAEARLADAKLNLSRINDIFDEVVRQMNSLKRQAAKAERYARLRDEMRGKLRLVLASRFSELERQTSELTEQLQTLGTELSSRTEAMQALETEHREGAARNHTVEIEARQAGERLNQLTLEMDRAAARRRHNEERCAELEARSAGAEAEIAQTEQQLAGLQQELTGNQQVLESAAAEVAAAQSELRSRQQEAQAATNVLQQVERDQEQHRRAIMEAVSAASAVRNRLAQAEERIAALDREVERLSRELATASQQAETFGGQRGQAGLEFESAQQTLNGVQEAITDARRQLEEKRQAEAEGKRSLDGMRAEFATLQGKRASLEAVINEHGYSSESVRRLLRSGAMQGGMAPVGVLADFLEVEDRYEAVVDEFLREELNYIVVKSWDAADEGLRLLRSDVDGRATFLVHPEDSQAKFSFVFDENLRRPVPADRVLPLKNCIRVLDGFGKSLEVILPKLGNGYIVPSVDAGRSLALENPDAFFLSQSGECCHNVTVSGGKQRSEGPLSLKRELREVQRQLSELERAMGEKAARIALLGREITELTQRVERLENERHDADKRVMTSSHALRQLDAEMARVRERLGVYEREIDRVGREKRERQEFIDAQQAQLAEQEERRAGLEERMRQAQDSVTGLREDRERAAQAASEAMAKVATLEERRRAAAASLTRIQAMAAEVNRRIGNLRAQRESATAECRQRAQENENMAARLVEWTVEHQRTQATETEMRAESEKIRARLAEIEEMLQGVRQGLDELRDRRAEMGASAAKLQSDLEHMTETCVQELSTGREELLADAELGRLAGEELAAEETAYREMRGKLEGMGPVNMMALEEYQETAKRHEFLDTQRRDLLESIENTQNTIKEIDAVTRQKFDEAFAAINENFQKTFTKLFGGGLAFMKLTDAENSAESGIDLVASPPGKKLQNVLLLSGGEKAMTALALLVGIFQYQPSPFCILDEVDAPLDESNVARFTELVREMSLQTQFILITHSKKTMSIAPVMYGVTMQEPGVSKIVSVRFSGSEKDARNVATA